MKRIISIILISLFCICLTTAKVRISNAFSNNMVLQQGKELNIWGKAEPNERVTVKIADKTAKTVADSIGRWKLKIPAIKASSKPIAFIIKAKSGSVTLQNVLVGEVWLASGQSNMEYSMNNHPKYCRPQKGDPERLYKEYMQADNKDIRIMLVEKSLKTDSLPTTGWHTLNQESLKKFSAPAYFFAKALQDSLGVPVGIISSAWGGTAIEGWTPAEAYKNSTKFSVDVTENGLLKPTNERIGVRYDKMIAPLAPMTIKGFIWYQGETNLILGDTDIYTDKMIVLVDSWRKAWGDENLPFYYVQISPLRYSQRKSDMHPKTWQDLPKFWEAQTKCLSEIPNTGMVVTTDIPENLNDIHPSYKWIVGERFANLALNNTYGKDSIVCNGPMINNIHTDGDKIVLTFDNIGSGLVTNDGKSPDWFYILTNKNKMERAKATLKDNKVYLEHPNIKKHTIIRFGWDEVAQPNLINKEGLPAVPFSREIDI